MSNPKFTKGIERLINPIDVGSLHFIQQFNSLLPTAIQNKLIANSAKQTPFMGFVVEPYSVFLCYEITDLEQANRLLPKGFKLIKTRIFDTDEPKYYCIFGCVRAHTSAFWGMRVEFYLIAEDESTGLLSWIIVDYDSNTISHDKKYGLRAPNSSKAVHTIDHRGRVFVDVPRDDASRSLVFDFNVEVGKMRNLDQRLWLEGNLSIGYGSLLDGTQEDIFALKFDPCEVEKALTIPLKDVHFDQNSWFPGLFAEKPSQVVCFPYAQHFLSDSPGHSSKIKSEAEMVAAANAVDFDKVKVFSTKSFKTMFMVGMAASFVITTLLLVLLVLQ